MTAAHARPVCQLDQEGVWKLREPFEKIGLSFVLLLRSYEEKYSGSQHILGDKSAILSEVLKPNARLKSETGLKLHSLYKVASS